MPRDFPTTKSLIIWRGRCVCLMMNNKINLCRLRNLCKMCSRDFILHVSDKKHGSVLAARDVIIEPGRILSIPKIILEGCNHELVYNSKVNQDTQFMIGPAQMINHHCASPLVFNSNYDL